MRRAYKEGAETSEESYKYEKEFKSHRVIG